MTLVADIAEAHPHDKQSHAIEASDENASDTGKADQEIFHVDLLVPKMHCAGCIGKIENKLNALRDVTRARVNLSSKRVSVDWRGDALNQDIIQKHLEDLGFASQPISDYMTAKSKQDQVSKELLRALAVSGFATANIMLLSVSIWSGASDATQALFQWLSALIAFPAVLYAGQPFFKSAWAAVKHYQLNMDVPISLAVILATGMSLFETISNTGETYFDAAVMLLFFLLIGRYLDYMMREKARSAISHLLSLTAHGAHVIEQNGETRFYPVDQLETGMHVRVVAGEHIPVDGAVLTGRSDVDMSVITGESAPVAVGVEQNVYAGALNLTGPLDIKITSLGKDTLLSEMVRLMEAAEESKARFVRLSQHAARVYAPVVHLLAAICFAGWMVHTQGDWHTSLVVAISVLIITCPCALGLAVPVVQIVAAGVLFRNGIMVKDGAALEKLAQVDTVAFDKTGTLTLGKPKLVSASMQTGQDVDQTTFAIAAGLANHSHHPLSQALKTAAQDKNISPVIIENLEEIPGCGMQGFYKGQLVKLGQKSWCGFGEPVSATIQVAENEGLLELCFTREEDDQQAVFHFEDELRPNAKEAIQKLKHQGLDITLLSGDRVLAVKRVANLLNIQNWKGLRKPKDKVDDLNALAEHQNRKVFMVGDGLNDAPALAAGFTSMASSSASDVGRMAADFVFLGDSLQPVSFTQKIAKIARRLILQNFALAAIYNMIAIPIAVLGFASPLVAAIAMSSSSIVVICNALRLQVYNIERKS